MGTNIQTEKEIEIDLGELFRYLLGRAVYILLTGIVFAVVTFAVTTFLISPKYTSTTKMYVLNRQTNGSITNSDLQSSTYLTQDYMVMIKSRTVVETVIREMDLEMTYEELLSSMDVSTTADTRVVAISVTNEDPYLARNIADEIRIAASAHIQEVMNIEAVNVVDEANMPSEQSSPKVKRDVVLAGAIGVFLAAAFFIVLFLVNDKITTTEDVERYLGLSILATMPLEEGEAKKRKTRKKWKSKNGGGRRTV